MLPNHKILLQCLVIFVSAYSQFSIAGTQIYCQPPADVLVKEFPTQIPKELLRNLSDKYGGFAQSNDNFNEFDVELEGRYNRRMVFAWNIGNKWLFATEHGGRTYNAPILLYEYESARKDFVLLKEVIAYFPEICKKSEVLIKSVRGDEKKK